MRHLLTKNQKQFLEGLLKARTLPTPFDTVIAETYLDRRAARELNGDIVEVFVQGWHITDENSIVLVRLTANGIIHCLQNRSLLCAK